MSLSRRTPMKVGGVVAAANILASPMVQNAARRLFQNGRWGSGRSPTVQAGSYARAAKRQRVIVKPKQTTKISYSGGSKSAGKYKKGRKARRLSKSPMVKRSNGGVNATIETTKVQEGADLVCVGHSTHPRYFIYEHAIRALWYKIAIMMNVPPISVNDKLDISDATTFTVSFRTVPTGPLSTNVYTVPAGGTSIIDLTAWWVAPGRSWYNSYEVDFVSIVSSAATNNVPVRVNMSEVYVKYYVKTSLKLQNRSLGAITGETGDENAVDNVPLYGKSYSGNGTGPKLKNDIGVTFFCDQQYGGILPTLNALMREPPQINQFTNAKFSNKVSLEPGDIKTSVLTHSTTQMFNTIHRDACDWSGGSNVMQRQRLNGKYRVFFFEKMIGIGAANIQLAFENNIEGSFQAVIRKRPVLLKEFNKFALT